MRNRTRASKQPDGIPLLVVRPAPAPPTRRERDVLSLLGCGYSRREVGILLGVTDLVVSRALSVLRKHWRETSTKRCMEIAWENNYIRIDHLCEY